MIFNGAVLLLLLLLNLVLFTVGRTLVSSGCAILHVMVIFYGKICISLNNNNI